MNKEKLIVVRGGGDLASGLIHKLWKEKFRVLILETKEPSAIRRKVAFSEAVYTGTMKVEGAKAVLVTLPLEDKWELFSEDVASIWAENDIPILVDPFGISITHLKPDVVIDAIIAKKNLGTYKEMAPLTIALGPGFQAGVDVDYVIETMRGDTLGQVITEGYALKNTGIPGEIAGVSKERVIHAPASGTLRNVRAIGDVVSKGDVIAYIEMTEGSEHILVHATIDGVLRGLIRDGYMVAKGFKIADIDPRLEERENCNRITDKAKCIAESVLEIINRIRHEDISNSSA